jgi:hypothetical protein
VEEERGRRRACRILPRLKKRAENQQRNLQHKKPATRAAARDSGDDGKKETLVPLRKAESGRRRRKTAQTLAPSSENRNGTGLNARVKNRMEMKLRLVDPEPKNQNRYLEFLDLK